jgi:UDP-3-O-[3-hydroxymyristoyl] glucosamine N-acyltransferase
MKPVPVRVLAELCGGHVEGDPERLIKGVADLHVAGPDDLCFLSNLEYLDRARATNAGALLVSQSIETAASQIVVKDVRLAFVKLATYFFPRPQATEHRIHPRATIEEGAVLEAPVDIGPNVVVEAEAKIGSGSVLMGGVFVGARTRIGRDCVLHPNAVICQGVVLGERVTIQSGTVIGGTGFGYAREGDRWMYFPQVGTVVVEDDVEIGVNCAIDRAAIGVTKIGRGTKIDNLVHLAHNCTVGTDTVIAAGSFFSGGVKIGSRVMIAGHVLSTGHLSIADDVKVGGNSGILHDIVEPKEYMGWPLMEKGRWFRTMRVMEGLIELRDEVRRLSAAQQRGGDARGLEGTAGHEG